MAKDILKEAIADAKAVREVALANAKAALEEAFTPKLQSMLSARLSEELDEAEDMEEMGYGNMEEDEMEETSHMMDEEEMEEMNYGSMEEEDMEEMNYGNMEEDEMEETVGMEKEGKDDLDEEIDLEEILNELELEEAKDEDKVDEAKKDDDDVNEGSQDSGPFRGTVAGKPKRIKTKVDTFAGDAAKEGKEDDDAKKEAKDDMEEEKLDEARPIYKADNVQTDHAYKADYVNEDEDFDLDSLLKEIESLEEKEDDDSKKEAKDDMGEDVDEQFAGTGGVPGSRGGMGSSPLQPMKGETMADYEKRVGGDSRAKILLQFMKDNPKAFMAAVAEEMDMSEELEETKAALETVKAELTEVNLLNSKLLYVNRIFKANTLDEAQKLRVVETLDKAETAKEAKLIYETIKDTFNVAKSKKESFKNKTKSLKEGIGMASKAAGTSTAPKQEVISESSNMVNRFQKLANIKINQ